MAGAKIKIGVEELKCLLNLSAKKKFRRLHHILHKRFPAEFDAAPQKKKRKADDLPLPPPPKKKIQYATLPRLELEDPHEVVKTRETVWPLVVRLHEQQPDHPMFGPRTKGVFR